MKLKDFSKLSLFVKIWIKSYEGRQIFLDVLIDEAEVFWTAFWLRSFFLYCIESNLE